MVPEHVRYYLRERRPVLAHLLARNAATVLLRGIRPARHRLIPRMVILRLTHRCNPRCRPCGQWGVRGVMKEVPASAFTELTTLEWRAFIESVSHYCSHVYLFGGEPFVRR